MPLDLLPLKRFPDDLPCKVNMFTVRQSKMDVLLTEINRLVEYPDWHPLERCQVSFYYEKLSSLSKEFQSFTSNKDDAVYVSLLNVDSLLQVLDSLLKKLSSLPLPSSQISYYSMMLSSLCQQIRSFKIYVQRDELMKKEDLTIVEKALLTDLQVMKDGLFDSLLTEVNIMLRICPDLLPTKRMKISLYLQKARSISTFHIRPDLFGFLDGNSLNFLISRAIFDEKVRTSVDFEFDDCPDHLTLVGDQLAYEVAAIYKVFMQKSRKKQEFDTQYFCSQFYFDKNKFQEKLFVGFQEEANDLLQQLVCITKKQLKVISIVGMAGLGKTTLARRLFDDPYIVSYFYVRSWVTCSQVYQRRNLLLSILKSVVEITDDIGRMNDNMLAHALYRALKGRRYLIIIDDIWSSKAWDDFRTCFPDDNNGSRIMLTTRLKDVALHAQSDGNPLCLCFLTEEEGFDLFRTKVGRVSQDLNLIGKTITSKCHGLPLAIVVIAGLLKSNFQIDWWVQVAESVRSYIETDENHIMDALALSYDHLPQHLRPCFLSFGAFPEDHDMPVHTLIWLWIAEGFIPPDDANKSLEDVAEDYLMDLIGRSLIVVGKKGSNGKIKTCRIHDILRDLCLRKVKEESFVRNIYKHNKHTYSCPHSLSNPSKKCQLLICTNDLTIPSDSTSCCSSEVHLTFFKNVSIICDTSKLIRSLDISSIELFIFPSELLQLVHLRYLELRFRSGNPPESISQLKEVRTLIMSSRRNMVVPENMWKMINLRHLCIRSGENLVNFSNVEEEASLLENLRTMSLVSPTRPCQKILARTRNLQKLGLCGPLTTKSGDLNFPDLGHLMHLKILKLLNTIPLRKAGRLSTSSIFPGTLKSLTMSNTYLVWNEARVFQMMPNLQVLKLKFHAFVGNYWETCPESFPRLIFLKLDELDIKTWTASRIHFPVLQRLQVYRSPYLMEIPEDFGNICTLEWIELSGCSDAATNSAMEIQKEQESFGNDCLKVICRS